MREGRRTEGRPPEKPKPRRPAGQSGGEDGPYSRLPQPRQDQTSPARPTPRRGQSKGRDLGLVQSPWSVGQGSPSQDVYGVTWHHLRACENSRSQEGMEGLGPGHEGPPRNLEGHPGDQNMCPGPQSPDGELPRRRGTGDCAGRAAGSRGETGHRPPLLPACSARVWGDRVTRATGRASTQRTPSPGPCTVGAALEVPQPPGSAVGVLPRGRLAISIAGPSCPSPGPTGARPRTSRAAQWVLGLG